MNFDASANGSERDYADSYGSSYELSEDQQEGSAQEDKTGELFIKLLFHLINAKKSPLMS